MEEAKSLGEEMQETRTATEKALSYVEYERRMAKSHVKGRNKT